MGCIQSSDKRDAQAKDVDKEMTAAYESAKKRFKVLLLGAGEAGKSTVLKQVRMIYNKGEMSTAERMDYKNCIRACTIECMQVLVNQAGELGVKVAAAEAKTVLQGTDTTADFTPTVAKAISTLWNDGGIRSVYSRRSEFWLLDAAPYYFNNASRFSEPTYECTEEDAVMARVRTTGIVTSQINQGDSTFEIVDVGGQRSERRKWARCFSDVNGIAFVAGLNGYNQVMFEDVTCNRMQESLTLFKDVVSNPLFASTPIFLLLNKKDLFETMLRRQDLSCCFPSAPRSHDTSVALSYVVEQFQGALQEATPNKQLYIHIVAARVRMDMKVAFADLISNTTAIYHGDALSSPSPLSKWPRAQEPLSTMRHSSFTGARGEALKATNNPLLSSMDVGKGKASGDWGPL